MSLHFAQGRLKGALGRPPIEDLFSVLFSKGTRKQTENRKKTKSNRKTV
jgi:hypothetical protein